MLNFISKVEKTAIALLFAFSTIILFVTVIMRYFFNASPSWTEEASRYLMIWIIYIGVSQTIETNSELKIDILTKFIKSRAFYKASMILGTIISIIVSIYIVIYGFKFTLQLKEMNQAPGSFNLPMYLIYIIIPITAIIWVFKYCVRLYSLFQLSKYIPGLYEYPYNFLRNIRNIFGGQK